MSRVRIAMDEVRRIYREWFGAPSTGTALADALTELDWTRASVALPARSTWVLAWDGFDVWVAFVQYWADGDPVWKMAGRDGYGLEGVTHWQPLPHGP